MTPPAGVIPTKTSSVSHSLRMSLRGGPEPGSADGPQGRGLDGAHRAAEGERQEEACAVSIHHAR